jgi:hypothetical protein
MTKKLKPIPKFASEAEERAFWEDESERHDGILRLEQGEARHLPQSSALDQRTLSRETR